MKKEGQGWVDLTLVLVNAVLVNGGGAGDESAELHKT